MRATCPAHLILFGFTTRTIVDEEYRLLNWLWSFLHSPVTPSLLGPNILLNALFSNLSLRFHTSPICETFQRRDLLIILTSSSRISWKSAQGRLYFAYAVNGITFICETWRCMTIWKQRTHCVPENGGLYRYHYVQHVLPLRIIAVIN
jgi:hypothetical protein